MNKSDTERSGCRIDATGLGMIEKIHDLVMDDRRLKVPEIFSALGISRERVINILHLHMNMKKLSARWMP